MIKKVKMIKKMKYDWWYWILIAILAMTTIIVIKILFFGGVE